jgi:hypothetical protein
VTTTPTTPPADLETQIRQAIHTAHQHGCPTPGRPTLVRLTGATDHAVRRILAHLATEHHQAVQHPDDHLASTGDPGATSRAPLTLVATNSGEPDHQPPDAGDPKQHQATSPSHLDRQPDHQPTPPGGRLVAWTGFLFGSTMSIAANVLHAWLPATQQPPGWTPGLAPQVGAAVWPIGLMLAVEALSRIRWPGGLGWGLARFGGAGTVALGSAVISYGHLRDVLTAWQYNPLAAAVGPWCSTDSWSSAASPSSPTASPTLTTRATSAPDQPANSPAPQERPGDLTTTRHQAAHRRQSPRNRNSPQAAVAVELLDLSEFVVCHLKLAQHRFDGDHRYGGGPRWSSTRLGWLLL